ncbi:hypothetical protein PAPYR_1411 [Paratrimastix pyriformis]|uniref:Polycystin cation channel PKD1/PKD2 domain-containing protein n=1 Tax=Paratrimastix pyriformis TaxID=342808 RepID=A0ABQ8USV5_9EUKA|nr:hypothetical protein PAPYR_1411 [Paratrimastix pyriformis]
MICRPKPLTVREELTLSPWGRFMKGHMPWRFIIHLALVLVSAFDTLLPTFTTNPLIAAHICSIEGQLLPEALQEEVHRTHDAWISQSARAIACLQTILGNYWLNNLSLAEYQHEVATLQRTKWDGTVLPEVTLSQEHPYGPFEAQNSLGWVGIFRETRAMSITFRFSTSVDSTVRWGWAVQFDFDFVGGAAIHMTMNTDVRAITLSTANRVSLLLEMIVVGLASLSVLLTLASVWRSCHLVSTLRSAAHWNMLPLRSKLRLFNGWLLITLSADGSLIVGSLVEVSEILAGRFPSAWAGSVQAIGIALEVLGLVRYLEYNPPSYLLIATLRKAMPVVMRYIMGVMPLFFGYSLLGIELFGQCSARFASLGASCETLFSLVNSDELGSCARDLHSCDVPFLSSFFLYSFVAVFAWVILTMFVTILQESRTLALQKLEERPAQAYVEEFFDFSLLPHLPADEDDELLNGDIDGEAHSALPGTPAIIQASPPPPAQPPPQPPPPPPNPYPTSAQLREMIGMAVAEQFDPGFGCSLASPSHLAKWTLGRAACGAFLAEKWHSGPAGCPRDMPETKLGPLVPPEDPLPAKGKVAIMKLLCALESLTSIAFLVMSIYIQFSSDDYGYNWLSYLGLLNAIAIFMMSICGYYAAHKRSRFMLLFFNTFVQSLITLTCIYAILTCVFRPTLATYATQKSTQLVLQFQGSLVALTVLSAVCGVFLFSMLFLGKEIRESIPATAQKNASPFEMMPQV